MRRAWVGAIGAAGAMALVTGCVADVPAPVTQPPELELAASLLEPQAARVVEDTMAELAAADSERDSDLFGVRIGGDAATVRRAEYRRAEGDGPDPTVLPSTMQALYVSGAEGWPRTLVGVTEQASEDATPVVMFWVQESIESPYQLRGWAHMIPGATLPAMPGPSTGADQVELTDGALDPTAQEQLENYLELLREGSSSDHDEAFAEDNYRERLFAARSTLSEAASDANGEYVDTVQSDIDNTFAMATADGGALVFAPVRIASSFSVERATVSIPEADEPLLDGEIDDQVTHHYRDFIVMYIPGPDVDELPAVVAADHNLVRVSDS